MMSENLVFVTSSQEKQLENSRKEVEGQTDRFQKVRSLTNFIFSFQHSFAIPNVLALESKVRLTCFQWSSFQSRDHLSSTLGKEVVKECSHPHFELEQRPFVW